MLWGIGVCTDDIRCRRGGTLYSVGWAKPSHLDVARNWAALETIFAKVNRTKIAPLSPTGAGCHLRWRLKQPPTAFPPTSCPVKQPGILVKVKAWACRRLRRWRQRGHLTSPRFLSREGQGRQHPKPSGWNLPNVQAGVTQTLSGRRVPTPPS